MKKAFSLLIPLSLVCLISCGSNKPLPSSSSSFPSSESSISSSDSSSREEKEDVTIIYTNDIHGYIANVTKDPSGEEIEGLRLSHVSGYVDHLRNSGKNVLVVDAGDEVQGSVYGALDRGKDMIKIMNQVGYNLATPGNHDFDFKMEGFNYLVDHATFPYISCNFKTLPEYENVLDSYKVLSIGGSKIGFVGISTPDTIVTSTPSFFQNDKGEFIYTFLGYDDPQKLYKCVQESIDAIKDKVDYVIALGHTGMGAGSEKIGATSKQIIENTTGLSAYIDGHSHTTMEGNIIKTKDGKDCLLTQTGCYLNAFGEMNITKDGKITTKLLKDSQYIDSKVKQMENDLIAKINGQLGQEIATASNDLYINDPQEPSIRLIRRSETNLADLCSDAIYWFLNEEKDLDCDIALVNGGGIRTNIKQGKVTYLDAKSVHPFGNQICLVRTKGINIKNAIEMGCVDIGNKKDDGSYMENGGFLHIAGMKYDLDLSVPSSVKVDDKGMFVSVNGEYRVKNLKIYSRQSKTYEDLDENKDYLVSGINYILKNAGNGLSMFLDSENVVDYLAEDYMVLSEYMKAFENATINNAGSPVKIYEGYLYDYENPYGSGRINFLNLD